jgi:hypothetical protein
MKPRRMARVPIKAPSPSLPLGLPSGPSLGSLPIRFGGKQKGGTKKGMGRGPLPRLAKAPGALSRLIYMGNFGKDFSSKISALNAFEAFNMHLNGL